MSIRLDKLEEEVLNTINKNNLIEKGDVIVVGVSGGPDSITLLAVLNKFKEKLGIKLVVCHVNHLIRKDSTIDEEFVESSCEKLKIECYVKRVDVEKLAKEEKVGTEEEGRKIRYDFFDEIGKKVGANKIAIAHNKNDNAETVLLNLIRGSGLNGLEGIQPKEYGKYIRPLINVSREEIERYCDSYNLNPRIDSTNKENIYKRNRIRNELIPYLKELNPNIIENLSRISKIVKTENEYIKKNVEIEFTKKIVHKKMGYEIDIKEFNALDICIRQNLIFYIINKLFGHTKNIEKTNIDDIIIMAENNIGNKYMLVNKNLKILVKNKKISFERLA